MNWPVPMSAAQQALGDTMPNGEGAGASGSSKAGSRTDHTHPRMSTGKSVTLDSSGNATAVFGRTFPAGTPPVLSFCYEEAASNQPIIIKRTAWVQDVSGNYTGVTIHGFRMQKLPATIALLSALVSYDVAGASASGIPVDVIAIPQG